LIPSFREEILDQKPTIQYPIFHQTQHPIINVQIPIIIQAQPLVINPIQKLNTPVIDPTIDDDDNSNLKMKNEKKEVKT
jgi:hypothetical protein